MTSEDTVGKRFVEHNIRLPSHNIRMPTARREGFSTVSVLVLNEFNKG
jgi:hypothetical protein